MQIIWPKANTPPNIPDKNQEGQGFWRLNNSLLKDLDYIKECNEVIKKIMKQYSEELRNIAEPFNEQYCEAKADISSTFLHDVILMEVGSMTLGYEARKKREQRKKMARIGKRIDKTQNSNLEEDNL